MDRYVFSSPHFNTYVFSVIQFAMYSHAVDSICICDNADVHFINGYTLDVGWLEMSGVHGSCTLGGMLVEILVLLRIMMRIKLVHSRNVMYTAIKCYSAVQHFLLFLGPWWVVYEVSTNSPATLRYVTILAHLVNNGLSVLQLIFFDDVEV